MGDREQAVESWCPKRKVVTIVMNDPNRKRERGCKKTKPFEWSYFSGLEYLVRWPRLQQTVGMGGARIHKHQHKCRQCGHTKLITTRSMVNLKCEGSVWLMSGRRKIKCQRVYVSACAHVFACVDERSHFLIALLIMRVVQFTSVGVYDWYLSPTWRSSKGVLRVTCEKNEFFFLRK